VPFFDKKKLNQQLLFQQPTTQPQQQKTGRNNAWLLQNRFFALPQQKLWPQLSALQRCSHCTIMHQRSSSHGQPFMAK
jgi:hypothetical protein